MSFIDLTSSSYNNLAEFGVLANYNITTTVTPPIRPILNNGYYGTTDDTYVPPAGTFVPAGSPQGKNTSGATLAQSGLTQLITDINNLTYPITTILPGYTGANINLVGGRIYKPIFGCYVTDSTINFDGSNPNAQFFIVALGGLTFTRVTFVLNGVSPSNIFWVAGGGLTATYDDSTTSPMYGNFISSDDSTFTYPSVLTGHIFSQGAVTITPQTSVNITTINTSTSTPPIVCYAKGSLIFTKQGFVPIETLKAGDTIVTKGEIHKNKFIKNEDLKIENVQWISKFKVFDLNSESRPICIKKNALGKNKPFKDLYVSPNHGLLINNKLIAARNILNGTTIYQDMECDEVEYYHLECEKHTAIFANGILSESYLEANNRDVFENSIKLKHIPKKRVVKHKLARLTHQ